MRRVAFVVAYDGTAFSGWQRQAQAPSIQESIEEALKKIHAGKYILCTGASRTDAGVHAQGQVAYFDTELLYDEERWFMALNSLTPPSIHVRKVFFTPLDFNPRVQNCGKHYCYKLWSGHFLPTTLLNCCVRVPRLNIDQMRRAAEYCIGTHDFSAFRAVDCQAQHAIRTITEISINSDYPAYTYGIQREEDSLIQIDVKGTAFLKYMVRILVGTLVDVGLGERDPDSMRELILKGERKYAGQTMPAKGLSLLRVFLDESFNLYC